MNVRLAQQMQPANLAAVQEIIRRDLKQRVQREAQTAETSTSASLTDPPKTCKDIREFALCTRSWRDETCSSASRASHASPHTAPRHFKHIREPAVCRFRAPEHDAARGNSESFLSF
jgi:hypothetical protein